MVIDLAVEDDHGVAAIVDHELIPAFEVDNLQPCGAQRHRSGFKYALLIGSAVHQCLHRALDTSRGSFFICVREARNTTQFSHPLAWPEQSRQAGVGCDYAGSAISPAAEIARD